MTKQDYLNDIEAIVDRNGNRRAKYRRNLRAYLHTYGFGMTNIDDTSVAGYYSSSQFDTEEDTTSGIQENIIKSAIDTLVSIMAAAKVRPFFNTVNGTFKDIQIVKQAQQFFDQLYDDQDVHRVVINAFRDSCIFDTGIIYVDKIGHTIERIMPWQINLDNRESSYNQLTRCVWKAENYPVTLLPFTDSKLKKQVLNTNQDCTYIRYWNLNELKLIHYIPEFNFYKEEVWEENTLPFIFMNYEIPIKSGSSSSIVDILWGLQDAIDAILVKIKDASQLASPIKYFVPETSSIKVNKLTDRVGEVVTYTALPNQTTPPIVVATEPFMDPQWQQLLDKFKTDAYEIIGVSQLSASMQKPKGLNSGVAISTMEDIELGRFEVQSDMVIRTYTDLAKLCIELFDENEDILPPNRMRDSITWRDIVEAKQQLIVQFSSAENLSKDPQTRSQQVMMLVQMGVIPQTRVASLMEIPDAVQGYSLANNNINAVMKAIDNCIEKDEFDVPSFVDRETLMNEILNTQLSLYAGNYDNNKDDIAKLDELYLKLSQEQMESQTNSEMGAVQQLANEVNADMQNPNGQIPQAINQGIQDAETNVETNNKEIE